MDEHYAGEKLKSLPQFVRTLGGLNSRAVKADLKKLGYLYRRGRGGRYFRRSEFRHLFVEKADPGHDGSFEIYLTQAGCELVVSLHQQGKLTKLKATEKPPKTVHPQFISGAAATRAASRIVN